MTLDDLRAHETDEVDPLAMRVENPPGAHALILLEQPPVSQGAMVPAILMCMEEADRRGLAISGTDPRATAREIHLQVEVYRRIRADRDLWFCDSRSAPASFEAQLAGWMSGAGATATVAAIEAGLAPVSAAVREAKAAEAREAKARRKKAGRSGAQRSRLPRDTTYLCVVDAQGNAVSWIQSIFHPFGAGWVVPGTGILLNNRMTGFSLDPGSPNRIAPRKRTIHTLNPWMVLRDGTPWVIGGTPGAEAQVMVNVQVLRARIARSAPLVEAIRAPRWHLDAADRVHIEARFPREVRRRLERRGHTVVRDGPWDGPGFFQAIERLDGGGWLACTDPRGEGLAIGM
jgi:gamma-glutamyltranspeptidase/glutathione hydrolase